MHKSLVIHIMRLCISVLLLSVVHLPSHANANAVDVALDKCIDSYEQGPTLLNCFNALNKVVSANFVKAVEAQKKAYTNSHKLKPFNNFIAASSNSINLDCAYQRDWETFGGAMDTQLLYVPCKASATASLMTDLSGKTLRESALKVVSTCKNDNKCVQNRARQAVANLDANIKAVKADIQGKDTEYGGLLQASDKSKKLSDIDKIQAAWSGFIQAQCALVALDDKGQQEALLYAACIALKTEERGKRRQIGY